MSVNLSRFAKWVGLLLLLVPAGVLFAALVIFYAELRHPLKPSGRWLAWAVWTVLLAVGVLQERRSNWQRPTFWVALVVIFAAHTAAYAVVLDRVDNWRNVWFAPISFAEYLLILEVLRRIFGPDMLGANHFVSLPFSARQRRLARSRKPLTKEDFVHRIAQAGGDTETAALVWNHLQDWIAVDGFTPYPKDSLGWVFGIAEEELDEDLVLMLLEKFSLSIPAAQEAANAFGPIDTPLQVAVFIARCREPRTA